MKRIIAFVLLGLVLYAGGFVLIVGLQSAMEYSNDRVLDFNEMDYRDFKENMRVEGSVDELREYYLSEGSPGDNVDEMYIESPSLFGIPLGKPRRVKRYLAEVGYAEEKSEKRFCIIAFCDENIEQADNAYENGGTVEFSGIIKSSDMINAKNNNPLIRNPDTSVIPYVIYVMNTDELFNPLPTIIVGAALILIGAAGTAILIFRIKREKEGY